MCDSIDFDERLELFFGGASNAVAHVYARVREVEADGRCTLSGSLSGPECQYAQTLPARFDFVDRGPGASILAAATVPDPCYWTPQMPHLYRATVSLMRDGKVVGSAVRVVGMRRLGAVGRDLRFDNQRWVVRGIALDAARSLEALTACHGASAALVVHEPSDELCQRASCAGVLLVAQLNQGNIAAIRHLSRWPAVGIIVLRSADPATDQALNALGRVCVLAQRFGPEENVVPQRWAQVAVVDVGDLQSLPQRIAGADLPLIAHRPWNAAKEIEPARAECDRLQRDLAASGALAGADWAGYVV